MGAWGTHPVDNDTAADWFGKPMRQLQVHIEKAFKTKDRWRGYDEIRAAAFLLNLVAYRYMYDISDLEDDCLLGIERLQGILEDEDYIGSWNDPAEIKRQIKKQIKDLGRHLSNIDVPHSTPLWKKLEETVEKKRPRKSARKVPKGKVKIPAKKVKMEVHKKKKRFKP